jgi:hypothetical protein
MQTLGLLVGLTLRNPANAERAVEEGCVDVVIEVCTEAALCTDCAHSLNGSCSHTRAEVLTHCGRSCF